MTPPNTDAANLLAGATVLVADDHEPNLVLMQRILAAAGISDVHVTADPRDVLRLFHEIDPDVVLLDLHMPGIDGVAVMTEIRAATGTGAFVPVIVLTADGTRDARERVLKAGANDFLTKPIDRTEVVLRVRNLLHTRSLHERLRAHNAELRAEVDAARAEENRARAEATAKRARIQHALDTAPPRVLFQPIVDLNSFAVLGYEALSRFDQQPCRPPNEWFDEAADIGLGTELELAAIRAALQSDGIPGEALLALNVSPATVTSGQLADLLIHQHSDKIVLEITEHARVDDYDGLTDALAPLREAGVLVAVDDAGAGFASLSHILRLRPDIIKLDISLVRDINQDPIKRALSSSLVTFAGEIGARIIAEGIETAAECHAVTALGVPWGQGYHLARPATSPTTTTSSSGHRHPEEGLIVSQ